MRRNPILHTAGLGEEKKMAWLSRIQDGGDKEKEICTEAEDLSHIILCDRSLFLPFSIDFLFVSDSGLRPCQRHFSDPRLSSVYT